VDTGDSFFGDKTAGA